MRKRRCYSVVRLYESRDGGVFQESEKGGWMQEGNILCNSTPGEGGHMF